MNIRTLHEKEGDSPDSPTKQARNYAGGEKSGLAIEMPGDFADHAVAETAPPGSAKVTLYKNGFRLNNSEFRSIEDEANREFVETVKAGYAPKELRDGHTGPGPVRLILDDRRHEEYIPPPPPSYVLFSGAGNRLDGGSSSAAGAGASSSSSVANVDVSRGAISLDSTQPTTNLQFRFPGGVRSSQTFNTSHTVGDIHHFIMQAAQPTGGYVVLEGFPPKEISTDSRMTLKEANLLNAALTVNFS